ncbi:MAG TPA: NADH:ubiquinone reductase (Na(+)-transporting) subunit A, partial [Candidatus Limisoma intestinavium]|nr:NADH:ubiquinone reductase (Na(+)-transporting) subunit A [Candidatus Limisoma intestinavium]
MSETIKIKKGLNINMVGEASGEPKILNDFPSKFAVIPDDYTGLAPKPLKKEGDSVVAGEALFADKRNPAIVVTSPVCGTITKIARGERRKILSFEIDADGDQSKRQSFQTANLSDENIIATLLASGLWAMLRQRPYGIVPDPNVRPRDIFISTFDTSPLAPD